MVSIHTWMTIALATGCSIHDDGGKDACNTQTDCLNGFICTNHTCVDPNGSNMGSSNGSPDAPGPPGSQYGDVQPITAASNGLTAADYNALIGTTTASGGLGCAVIHDESAAPGTTASLVYAKIARGSTGDTRCPTGNHAVVDDPMACNNDFGGLLPGCVQYKRWDDAGKQIANRLAIGGYIAIQQTTISSMDYRCSVDLSASFVGGVTIHSTFSFDYNPYGPEESFCTH